MVEEKPKGESKYPKTWTKCPACGCEVSEVNSVREDLIAQGKWNPALSAALVHPAVMVADPGRVSLQLTVPVVEAEIDICSKCGILYARKSNIKQVQAKFKMVPGTAVSPGVGMPPGFNNPLKS